MGKRRTSNQGMALVDDVSDSQIRRSQAELADQAGELQELDLHGQSAQQASVNVYGFLTSLADSGEPCCRIVHGKGTGVLQQVVKEELNDLLQQNIIDSYFQSQKYPGAAVVVVFRIWSVNRQ